MTRRNYDDYQTPFDCALAITKRVAEVVGPKRFIYEPSAGRGAFVRACREVYPTACITAVDVRAKLGARCLQEGAHGFYGEDYFRHLQEEGGFMGHSLITGNPPFSLALEFILASLNALPVGSHLALLLNLRIHAGRDRAEKLWSRRDLRAWFALAQRPAFDRSESADDGDLDFTEKGNDNSDYGVFIWERGFHGDAATLPPLIWKPEKLRQPKKNTQKKSKKPTS